MPIDQIKKLDEADRKAELVDLSQQLVKLFGFEKGKKMETGDIEAKLEQYKHRVKNALLLVYEHDDIKVAEQLAGQPEVQLAFLMNIQKMVEFGRERKNHDPYYVHPQSVSQKFIEYSSLDPKSLQEGVIGSLLHDYLEEGDGVSAESVEELRRTFLAFSPEMAEDLALLTEPNFIENSKREKPQIQSAIDYDSLKRKCGKTRKTLETIIFSMMLRASRLLQMVVPVDKLDNIEDMELVQQMKKGDYIKTPEAIEIGFLDNMAKVLATYTLYINNCTAPEVSAVKKTLLEKIEQKIEQMQKTVPALANLEAAVNSKLKEYHDILNNAGLMKALKDELVKYFRSLGLIDIIARL